MNFNESLNKRKNKKQIEMFYGTKAILQQTSEEEAKLKEELDEIKFKNYK